MTATPSTPGACMPRGGAARSARRGLRPRHARARPAPAAIGSVRSMSVSTGRHHATSGVAPMDTRSAASPRLAWTFTDPTEHPSALATSASGRSARNRSTSTSRWRRDRAARARGGGRPGPRRAPGVSASGAVLVLEPPVASPRVDREVAGDPHHPRLGVASGSSASARTPGPAFPGRRPRPRCGGRAVGTPCRRRARTGLRRTLRTRDRS